MRQVLAMLCCLVLVACGDADPKTGNGNNSNNVNNINNVNNVNNVNNGGSVINPDNYDKGCEFDGECALVYGGDVCGCRDICGSAIAQSALQDFTSDVEAVECTVLNDITCPGAACEEQMVVCRSSGTCEATGAVSVFASDFDQSCEVNEDCVPVSDGRLCQDCDCPSAAINVNAVEEYNAARQGVDCNPGPQVCDCALPEFGCNDGICTIGI